MKRLLLFLIVYFPNYSMNIEDVSATKVVNVNRVVELKCEEKLSESDSTNVWESAISHMKESEGFIAKVYNCPDGLPTIGYGHALLPEDSLLINDSITEEKADSILRKDLLKVFKLVTKELSDSVKLETRIVLACFSMNTGFYYFQSSKLCKQVKEKGTVDTLILKYCNYTNPKGKVIVSTRALKNRKWELELINSNR